MAHLNYNDYLLTLVRQTCAAPPLGVDPWRGGTLVKIIDRAARDAEDHRTFYVQFMEGIRDLVKDATEDQILRRFAQHALDAEPRIQAHDPEVRDHLTHVTQVFLCGWLIINGSRFFSTQNNRWKPYGWKDNLFERLNCAWMYTALLHDCAYSVEYARRGQVYEQLVKGLFRSIYRSGTAGAGEVEEIRKAALELWRERESWPNSAPLNKELIQEVLAKQYKRRDHAIVGGIALWDETARFPRGKEWLSDTLKCAAVSIACHNFQYLIEIDSRADDWPNSWVRLDFEREPLGCLLHLCDELQEWSREREDEYFLYQQSIRPSRFLRTELMSLKIDELQGLTMDVRLLRHLHLTDSRVSHRIRREHELRIAEKTQRLGILFEPSTKDVGYKIRLRVTETVGDQRCGNAILVNWPSERARRTFAELFRPKLKARHRGEKEGRPKLEDRDVITVVNSTKGRVAWIESARGGIDFAGLPARLLLKAPGGIGKSTVFKCIYRDCQRDDLLVGYCEQLPDKAVDLVATIKALRAGSTRSKHSIAQGQGLVLLIDHLDRIVDDELCAFWLSQLRSLPKDNWLRVVVASRPEEYDRYFSPVLQTTKFGGIWEEAELKPEESFLFPKRISPFEDDKHRPLPTALESLMLLGDKDCRTLASWAADMGNRRVIKGSAVSDPLPKQWNFEDRLGITPIITRDRNGNLRFAHDCIQDFLSATHLAKSLSTTHLEEKKEILGTVKQLESLPRDVPRLLFGLLANQTGTLLKPEERQYAARALARGLLWDCTIQQWLYDSARLQQSTYALEDLVSTYELDDEVAVIATKFLAHAAYERFNPNELEKTKEECLTAVALWVRSAEVAERLIAIHGSGGGNNSLKWACQWMLAFLADHVLLALTRRQDDVDFFLATRRLATDLSKSGSVSTAQPVSPGWLKNVLQAFGSAETEKARDDVLKQLYTNLCIAAAGEHDHNPPSNHSVPSHNEPPANWLDVRCAHLASHIGNYFLGCMFRRETADRFDEERLEEAVRWFERSIALREGVLRRMYAEGKQARDAEVFATCCQGYADAAHQYRGVFEARLGLCKGELQQKKLVQRASDLISAHKQQEGAWSLARYNRGPSERLPTMFGTSLPLLVIGEVLDSVLQSGQPVDKIEVVKQLHQAAQRMFLEHASKAEARAGFRPEFTYGPERPAIDVPAEILRLVSAVG